MATKTEIIDLIEFNLADESNISAELHREVELKLVNEFFSTVHVDAHGLPVSIFQQLHAGLEYQIATKKMGNLVFLYGFVSKGGDIGISPILNIVDDAFKPNVPVIFKIYAQNPSFNDFTMTLLPNGNVVNSSLSTISMPTARYFNLFYFVND